MAIDQVTPQISYLCNEWLLISGFGSSGLGCGSESGHGCATSMPRIVQLLEQSTTRQIRGELLV